MRAGRFAHAVEIAAVRGSGQDRACVFDYATGLVVALADGAGGTGNGAVAAQAIVDAVGAVDSLAHDWGALLDELDADVRLGSGQSTAVILSIDSGGVRGASVGDSGASIVRGSDLVDLTKGQVRKPLVGDGCVPFCVAAHLHGGTLVVASDGLFRYAKPADIVRIVNGADLDAAARALIDLVRLPSGALQDDVSVVLCREIE